MQKNELIKFEVEGAPQGQERTLNVVRYKYIRKGGHLIKKPYSQAVERKNSRHYKAEVMQSLQQVFSENPIVKDTPVSVYITSYFPIMKSYTKKKKKACRVHEIMPTKKPDVDNIAKAILDGLNNLAYHDDAQIVELYILKAYSDRPRAVVEFKPYDKPLRPIVDD